MANRFWVGNGGNWSDATNHWAASSGGAPGASLPTSADNVYFDALSFSLGSQTVTVDADANCLDADWTGASNNPTFNGNAWVNLYGSITYINAMTISGFTGANRIQVQGTGIHTITTGNNADVGYHVFQATGTYTFQDDFTTGNNLYIDRGTLNTNGKTVTVNGFQID